MKFNIYTIKRKIKFILTKDDNEYKIIKLEQKPAIETTEKGYRIKK